MTYEGIGSTRAREVRAEADRLTDLANMIENAGRLLSTMKPGAVVRYTIRVEYSDVPEWRAAVLGIDYWLVNDTRLTSEQFLIHLLDANVSLDCVDILSMGLDYVNPVPTLSGSES